MLGNFIFVHLRSSYKSSSSCVVIDGLLLFSRKLLVPVREKRVPGTGDVGVGQSVLFHNDPKLIRAEKDKVSEGWGKV